MDNSREECLPQTVVAKISAHAAGKGYPRLTFAGSVADADLCKGAGLAEGKPGSKWLRSSTRRGAAGAAQAAKAPVGPCAPVVSPFILTPPRFSQPI